MSLVFAEPLPAPDPYRAAVRAAYLAQEPTALAALIPLAEFAPASRRRIADLARDLVTVVRAATLAHGGLDALMHEYDLSSQEGVVLMCLAEALLRIPDIDTSDRLIRDKLADADWEAHLGRSRSLFVNASTWGLMLTGRIVQSDAKSGTDVASFVKRLVSRSGEPVIRAALREAMVIMSRQFVLGRTIKEALERSHEGRGQGYRYSFDMLGEAALRSSDAEHYHDAYLAAIDTIAAEATGHDPISAPGISVKLSALHPRFELAQRDRLVRELIPRVLSLALRARAAGIGMTVDAEEAERLEPTLDVFEAVFTSAGLAGWEGFGLAVQTYQKRALPLIDWLAALGRGQQRRIMLRLTKGAYWDAEIKRAQEHGLEDYPVFTHKAATDVSYLACARLALAAPDAFYPQFATHNAHTIAAVIELAGEDREFEFQRLHGMGDALYGEVIDADKLNRHCRVYAPVGSHEHLLPYLVRRLLENGSNTSFVNRIVDAAAPIEALITDPVLKCQRGPTAAQPRISLPAHVFGVQRSNSRGLNLHDPSVLATLADAMAQAGASDWQSAPIVSGRMLAAESRPVVNPARADDIVGEVAEAGADAVEQALAAAAAAAAAWDGTAADERASRLDRAADLLEAHHPELMALSIREGGRCIADALSEVREAVDFCRYYARQARDRFARPLSLPGVTGESNELSLHGRGVFACISPWNFPIAIFTGQVTAALAAGNPVIAKPAGQTPLAAARIVRLLHEAGVPVDVLHLLPGPGAKIGAWLLGDRRLAGVAFTGSTATAQAINRQLAGRAGPLLPFIAETGGQNAMIVDSSALPEQVVKDTLRSAFNSAGQRCSALRVLFVQSEVASRIIDLLQGAMAELRIGDPALLSTDVGPVIDHAARHALEQHIARMHSEGKLLAQVPLPAEARSGSYVAPCAFEIDRLARLTREVFGPVLHVIRYEANRIDDVIDAINGTGYGLTLGIHSRIDDWARYIQQRVRVGNTYVNRDMIGAVVGSQPFGGMGLSGTGPKAGGPNYLQRFAVERTYTVNTAAVGGNTALLGAEQTE